MEIVAIIISILALIISGWTSFSTWRKDKHELKHSVKARISALTGNYINLRSNFETLIDKLENIDTPISKLNDERKSIVENLESCMQTLSNMIIDSTELLENLSKPSKVADQLYEFEISLNEFQSTYEGMHELYVGIRKNANNSN
ncbi:MAG: hypothetical protein ABJH72_04395 [Reichenbachiella sp.]|uniref:hypothetical protein n=1 Tax=Reichenbachiella sp. TaxID=2184521 RepID=UPI00326321E4